MVLNKNIIIVLVIIAIPFAWSISFLLEKIQPKPEIGELHTIDSICLEKIGDKNKYAVSDIYNGELADINFNSMPEAQTFKAKITEEYKKGVNFAGHFNVASFGCGIGCQAYTITNIKTGNIISHGLNSELGAFFTPNSTLFILNPKENTPNPVDKDLLPYLELTQRKYYQIKDDYLELICEESTDSGIDSI
ncbi:MAG: hypothetical protein COV57_03235 [Candidatus Liptonbacteria bacterium CG11_big_fil_rev_8_21_14_0_20_35_14]|uniref:Uncharacterized protein n=1 Tax=Candidatus Liptonbacteria bacterium CG11_big_fil_rev_8_21_14_0_20_35_14 TaxID=1974634 RepID=A0A2H0N6Y4_9BACT|nr:MAG: hypothetical protein COV57_03235 [Candidatus Liptonbacteria bacterium CG11_big_fil_rev_8_21_14_0_20_35_14]